MKKVKLPIIGQVWISKEQPIKQIIEKASTSLLGGLVEFSGGKLSNNKTISTKLLEANTGWVYSNNDAIAQEVSKIEFELYTIGLSKGEIVYNEVKSHPLLTLLDKPNEETTKNDCIYITQSHKKLAGDSFWLKIRNGQQITSVRILQPDKITLILKDPTPENPNAVVGYKYEDVIDGQTIKITYPPEDIIHYKKPNPNNQFRGIGVVETLKETIDLDNLTTNTTINYFLNGAIQNFALTTESKITDEQLKRLKGEIRSSISGQKNAFNVPIFGGGMKPVDISYSNKDMEFLSQLEWYRDKIMVGFGNTKASLGIIDDVNRASNESSITSWLKSTVKPDMEAIVNTLNEYLVPEFGENLVLGFCDPVPEDRTSDITEVKDLYPAGLLHLMKLERL